MIFSGLKKERPADVMYNTTGQTESKMSPKLFSLRALEKTGGNRTHFVRRPSESCVSGLKRRMELIVSPKNSKRNGWPENSVKRSSIPPFFAKVLGERQGSEGSYPQRASFFIIIDWEILSPTRIVRDSVRSFSGRRIFVLIAPEDETNIPTESDTVSYTHLTLPTILLV